MSKQNSLNTITAALMGACLIAGCHSGSTAGATSVPPPRNAAASASAGSSSTMTTEAAGAPALPGNGLAGSSAPTVGPAPAGFVTKVCTAITIPHAQAPVKATVTKIDFDSNNEDPNGIFQCNIDQAHQALIVKVEPEDVTRANYTADVAAENVPGTPMAGVGDVAVWTQALHNPPNFHAHRGNATCEVSAGDIRELSLPNDASVIDGGVATPIAVTYAAKLGAICTDVFGAIG